MAREARHELSEEAEPMPPVGLAAISAQFQAMAGQPGEAGQAHPPAQLGSPRPGPFDIWPLRLNNLFLNAAGSIDTGVTDWAPQAGFAFELLGVTITLGAGATLVQAYDEAAQPANLLFQTTVSGIWGAAKILLPGERLVFVSTGGGMTIRLSEGNQVALAYLPTHLT